MIDSIIVLATVFAMLFLLRIVNSPGIEESEYLLARQREAAAETE